MNRLRQEREWLARVQVRSQANSPNSLYFFNPLLARAGKGEGPREVRAAVHHESETEQGAPQSLWAQGALGLGQPSNLDFTSKAKKQGWEVTREQKAAAVRPASKVDRGNPCLSPSAPSPLCPRAQSGESPNAHGNKGSPARRPQRRPPAGCSEVGGGGGG